MKKRVPALVLALALALTVPAWAAQDTPDNFVRSKTYAGQFSDLTPESTFYDNVAALYAYVPHRRRGGRSRRLCRRE